MRFTLKLTAVALILSELNPYGLAAQGQSEKSPGENAIPKIAAKIPGLRRAPVASRTLTPDEGLAVIAAALDSRVRLSAKTDCSHLVHALYERAGFPYSYASSSDLYTGSDEFQRVWRPQPGDLVLWRGHVGIVVNPAQHVFFSVLSSGPGIDAYDAPYWKKRGPVRFYRYVRSAASRDRTPHVRTTTYQPRY